MYLYLFNILRVDSATTQEHLLQNQQTNKHCGHNLSKSIVLFLFFFKTNMQIKSKTYGDIVTLT